jgi:hypothetical protein
MGRGVGGECGGSARLECANECRGLAQKQPLGPRLISSFSLEPPFFVKGKRSIFGMPRAVPKHNVVS